MHLKSRYARRVRSAPVLLGGRVLGRLSARHRTVKVNLKGRTGTVRVRIVMHLRGGRTLTDTRRYHVCTANKTTARR